MLSSCSGARPGIRELAGAHGRGSGRGSGWAFAWDLGGGVAGHLGEDLPSENCGQDGEGDTEWGT